MFRVVQVIDEDEQTLRLTGSRPGYLRSFLLENSFGGSSGRWPELQFSVAGGFSSGAACARIK